MSGGMTTAVQAIGLERRGVLKQNVEE